MKSYELMTITKFNTGEEGARNISNEIKDLISKQKGKVMNDDFWGKRKFAFKVGAETEGFYDVIKFEMEPEEVEKMQLKLKTMDSLVRYLVTAE